MASEFFSSKCGNFGALFPRKSFVSCCTGIIFVTIVQISQKKKKKNNESFARKKNGY
jgi:hypothetical protein